MIVSCSNSLDPNSRNVVLTHFATKSKLESFSNFQSNSKSSSVATAAAVSISFGGKAAKSRYLCVSDTSGAASVWDMKKISRVRCFKMKHLAADASNSIGRPSCIKSCMDPTDTHVVALHGSSPSCSVNRICVELFHLKTGSRVSVLETLDGEYGGGADCFQFSSLDNETLLVGARDGSLLLWDCSVSSIKAGGNPRNAPIKVLEQRHSAAVTDVAFSPVNKVLAASCSIDGSVGFHDINSQKTIQNIRPRDHGADNGDGNGLTSLAFHHDGLTWAVGTESGKIFTYDLRQTGAGPLCTMDLTQDITYGTTASYPVKALQFIQMNSSTNNGPKSVVKNKVSLADDGAVTMEREKTTPSRKEFSTTTYSMQKNEPPSTSSSRADPTLSFDNPTAGRNDSSSSKRSERVVKKTTTTRKTVTSSSPQHVGFPSLTPTPPESKEESTTTSELTTISPERPSTTKRVTKTKLSTSSPQRYSTSTFTSPPASTLSKDLFTNGSITEKSHNKDSSMDRFTSSPKKDMSVSFNNNIKKHVLGFEDNGSESDSSDEEAEQMMENFDAMYERIKSRAIKSEGNSKLEENVDNTIDEDDDSGDGFLANDANLTKPAKPIDNETAGSPNILQAVGSINSNEEMNDMITVKKSEIQDLIEEAVDSLRDDMEESMQSLQLNFLRQMQKQSDDVTAAITHHQQEMLLLCEANQELKMENESLRKLFQL